MRASILNTGPILLLKMHCNQSVELRNLTQGVGKDDEEEEEEEDGHGVEVVDNGHTYIQVIIISKLVCLWTGKSAAALFPSPASGVLRMWGGL